MILAADSVPFMKQFNSSDLTINYDPLLLPNQNFNRIGLCCSSNQAIDQYARGTSFVSDDFSFYFNKFWRAHDSLSCGFVGFQEIKYIRATA